MTVLAIDGGPAAIKQSLRPFNTIGPEEISMATSVLRAGPLSGYLGGELHGGLRVEALEQTFADMIGSKHAVAVNSATSGLLVACMAAGVFKGYEVITSPYTMSATAAAPAFLGANIKFNDIEAKTFNMDGVPGTKTRAIIVPNIFGHPAELARWKRHCGAKTIMIEDNAQAPFAMEDGKYAGTVGDIGVFSLNVHKHIQCGEGGLCVTDNDVLADRMRLYRNHSELADTVVPGLNLRMTEITAAIALAQLSKREAIITGRIELAEELTHMVKDIPWIMPPIQREGCKHVYYMWAAEVVRDRDWVVKALRAEGVPVRAGYVEPLYNLPAFKRFKGHGSFPITEEVNSKLMLFEVCAYDPSRSHMKAMAEAFKKVGDALEKRQEAA